MKERHNAQIEGVVNMLSVQMQRFFLGERHHAKIKNIGQDQNEKHL